MLTRSGANLLTNMPSVKYLLPATVLIALAPDALAVLPKLVLMSVRLYTYLDDLRGSPLNTCGPQLVYHAHEADSSRQMWRMLRLLISSN